VQGDPVQLQQVLINLIMNAIDAVRTIASILSAYDDLIENNTPSITPRISRTRTY
jgi:signal transduction histidine kinase